MEIQELFMSFGVMGDPVPWSRAGRSGSKSYTPTAMRKYKEMVRQYAALEMKGRALLKGPIMVKMEFELAIPPSYPEWKREAALDGFLYPTKTPDFDNLGKGICDALNKVVYCDDCQVIRGDIRKCFARIPSVFVMVYSIVEATSKANWEQIKMTYRR